MFNEGDDVIVNTKIEHAYGDTPQGTAGTVVRESGAGLFEVRLQGGLGIRVFSKHSLDAIPNRSGRAPDMVNHPPHYTSHASGIECIDVVEHLSFNIGNATKYLWMAGKKGDAVTDLEKSLWYIQREITRIKKGRTK